MRYEARVTAFDVMDDVWVSVTVTGTGDWPADRRGPLVNCRTTVQGTGESDPRAWARDALIAALEAL
jgi:hypothetical protein